MSKLRAFHAEVDREAKALAAAHDGRLRCGRGCSRCCVDELTVFEVEAERIRAEFPEVLRQAPHPPGACAFLDEQGACRVYEARPYVCRTQGLPLRWFEEVESEDGEDWDVSEERDICPLNLEGPPLAELPEEQLWLLGVHEDRLARLQGDARGSQRRSRLRDLFSE